MAQNVHITHIEDTWANILANADHGQLAIKNDATSELPYEELLWLNDDGTYIYAAAAQRRYDVGGGSWGFLDAQFDAVTVNDTSDGLLVAKYVKHLGDTDTLILFDDAEDKITVQAGGVTFVDFTEAAQDVVEFNSADADVDFIVNTDTADTLVIRGSDSVVAIGSSSAPAWKTATVTAVLSVGPYSALYGYGTQAGIIANAYYDVSDSRHEYVSADGASRIYADSYHCYLQSAPAGSADAAIDWITFIGTTAVSTDTGTLTLNASQDNVDLRWQADAFENGIFADASADSGLGRVGFGTGSPDRMVHIERDTATTDAVQYLVRLTSTCSETVGDGFGVGLEFELENVSIQATNYVAGSIEVIWEDESDGDSDMIFRVMDAGTAFEMLRLTSTGRMHHLTSGITWSADQLTAFTGGAQGVYSRVLPWSNTNGGLVIDGYNKDASADSCGIRLRGYVENEPTDEGAVHVLAYKHNGAGGVTALADASKIFAIENNTTEVIGVRGNGDTYLTYTGSLYIKEKAAANGDTAAYGQLWVKTATPCELWFTDDAGTDHQIAFV